MRRVIGIDFSGSAEQWKPRRKASNVWLAFGVIDDGRLRIEDLKPVQALEGDGSPFERLTMLLSATDAVVGIDAPFSVPKAYVSDAETLWAAVAAMPAEGRPFGKAQDLLGFLTPDAGKHGSKIYRVSEETWRRRGLNVRSTLWNGPRPGAPFAVACMTLLHHHAGPVWPFRPGGRGALLLEAYPAAQLKVWGLDPHGYNGAGAAARGARVWIVASLAKDHDLRASDAVFQTCIENADALDAVLCAYAAKALAEGRHPRRLPSSARAEGWVVVDEDLPPAGRPAPAPAADVAEPQLPPADEDRLVAPATEQLLQSLFDKAFEALASDARPTENQPQ